MNDKIKVLNLSAKGEKQGTIKSLPGGTPKEAGKGEVKG